MGGQGGAGECADIDSDDRRSGSSTFTTILRIVLCKGQLSRGYDNTLLLTDQAVKNLIP
jgi:hypothetical protein